VDVDVDADERLAAGDPQHQMRTFWAHPGERLEDLRVTGQLAIQVLEDPTGDLTNLGGLALMECAGMDEGIDLIDTQLEHLSGRAGAVEEAARGGDCDLIEGTNGNDAGCELLEGGGKPVLGQLKHGGLFEGPDGFLNAGQGKVYIEGLLAHRTRITRTRRICANPLGGFGNLAER
jgi:hypothetical protein